MQLKLEENEKKYRALFEYSPLSLWQEDFSEAKTYLGNLMDLYITNEVPLIKHILSDMGIIQSSTCTRDAVGTGDDKEEIIALMKGHGDFV